MNPFFINYGWKDGKPYGIQMAPDPTNCDITYKIVTDPYKKRFTIEHYDKGLFRTVVYDSMLLDFRKLNPSEQIAWQREILSDGISLIRNIEDRIILIEKYDYEENYCRKCSVFSPQGIHLSTHHMFYMKLNDAFNGLILSDGTGRYVMKKVYTANDEGEFGDLIQEDWDIYTS